jgi:hypothetical protein
VWTARFAPGALTHSLEAAPESDRLVVGPLDGRTLSLRSNLASQDDESPSGLAAHPRQLPMPAVRLNRSGRNCMVVMPLLCCAASSSEGDMAIVQTRATRTSARLRRAAPVAIAVALLWVPVYLALLHLSSCLHERQPARLGAAEPPRTSIVVSSNLRTRERAWNAR